MLSPTLTTVTFTSFWVIFLIKKKWLGSKNMQNEIEPCSFTRLLFLSFSSSSVCTLTSHTLCGGCCPLCLPASVHCCHLFMSLSVCLSTTCPSVCPLTEHCHYLSQSPTSTSASTFYLFIYFFISSAAVHCHDQLGVFLLHFKKWNNFSGCSSKVRRRKCVFIH